MRDASRVRCQDPHPNPPRNPLFQCTPPEFWEIGQTGKYSRVSETDHLKSTTILLSKNPITYFVPDIIIAYSGFYRKWISSCREFIISFLSEIQSEAVLFSHIRGWGGGQGLSQRYFECSSPSTSPFKHFKHPDWFKKGLKWLTNHPTWPVLTFSRLLTALKVCSCYGYGGQ